MMFWSASNLLVQINADSINEETVAEFVFEIIFAFDEVIAPHGYKENLTIQTVKTALEMDSNEERIAIALRKQKEQEAAEETKRRQAGANRPPGALDSVNSRMSAANLRHGMRRHHAATEGTGICNAIWTRRLLL